MLKFVSFVSADYCGKQLGKDSKIGAKRVMHINKEHREKLIESLCKDVSFEPGQRVEWEGLFYEVVTTHHNSQGPYCELLKENKGAGVFCDRIHVMSQFIKPVEEEATEKVEESVRQDKRIRAVTPVEWPTEQDIRECCGVWLCTKETGRPTRVVLVVPTEAAAYADYRTRYCLVDEFESRFDFDQWLASNEIYERLEPMPEQCMPKKPEPPKEQYVDLSTTPFPALAEFLGGF